MRVSTALISATLLLPQMAIQGQERKDTNGPGTYKLEFTIRDGADAAAKSGRHYMMLMELRRKAIFKIGSRVPVATGAFAPTAAGPGISPLVNTQYTYIDVGINIECVADELNGRLAMHGSLDLSTIAQNDAAPHASNQPNPTVTQAKLELDTTIDPGKPTVIAAVEDPVTMRHLQVEVLATRVD